MKKQPFSQKIGAFIILLSVIQITPICRADEIYTFVIKKQEEKTKSRWNLTDWLETRDRMRLMDLWLALHSPSPYEFFVSGAYQFGSTHSLSSYGAWDFGAAAFASIFGLEARGETTPLNRFYGMFDLRVFGYHDQSTNITLQGGLRSQEAGTEAFRNGLLGVRSTIYLGRFFGIEGLYRYFFNSTPLASGARYSGYRYEAGAFIDFKFLRVFGDYFSEVQTQTGSGASVDTNFNGCLIGTKFYF